MKDGKQGTGNEPALKPEAGPESKDDLKSLPMPEVEKRLESSPDGLTEAEAQKRLTQYGPNEIVEKKTNTLLKFLSYFWGPIPWMIEVAVVLSGVIGHWPDFFIILLLLVANAVVGFWEEREAGNAIAALKSKLAIKARVLRDGKWTTPAARELVPGDVIRLRLGDIVPADARLLDGDPVEVDQSALTGESLSAERKSGDAVFSGFFMTPLGWSWAGFVWGYALLWFLLNDRIKLLAYRIFDPVKPITPIVAASQLVRKR